MRKIALFLLIPILVCGSSVCYSEQNNYEKAKGAFEKVIQNYPQSKWVDDSLLQVGNCLFKLKDFSGAIKSYSKLEAECPKPELVPLAILMKSRSYFKLNELDKAKREYQKYLKLAKLATIKIDDISYTVREATEECPIQINKLYKLTKDRYFFLVLEIRNKSKKPVQLIELPKQIFVVLDTGEQVSSVTRRINYEKEKLSMEERNFFEIHTNPIMKIMPNAYQWIFIPFLKRFNWSNIKNIYIEINSNIFKMEVKKPFFFPSSDFKIFFEHVKNMEGLFLKQIKKKEKTLIQPPVEVRLPKKELYSFALPSLIVRAIMIAPTIRKQGVSPCPLPKVSLSKSYVSYEKVGISPKREKTIHYRNSLAEKAVIQPPMKVRLPPKSIYSTKGVPSYEREPGEGGGKAPSFRIRGPISIRGILREVRPTYPEWAKKQNIEASVELKFWVLPSGEVSSIEVFRTSGWSGLDRLASEALSQWRFEPIKKDVIQWGIITFRFKLG